jgi:hypothetical protein
LNVPDKAVYYFGTPQQKKPHDYRVTYALDGFWNCEKLVTELRQRNQWELECGNGNALQGGRSHCGRSRTGVFLHGHTADGIGGRNLHFLPLLHQTRKSLHPAGHDHSARLACSGHGEAFHVDRCGCSQRHHLVGRASLSAPLELEDFVCADLEFLLDDRQERFPNASLACLPSAYGRNGYAQLACQLAARQTQLSAEFL